MKYLLRIDTLNAENNAASVKMLELQYLHIQIQKKGFKKILHQQNLLSAQHFQRDYFFNKKILWGFPGGGVVESLSANAVDMGSSPGLGGSHMPRSDWAREPQLLSLRVWSLCSATREAATVRGPRTAMKSGPCLPQLEKDFARKRRPNAAKNK